jgi:thiosulfate/3-mercaptopyruvate sulfurtransferase
MSALFRRAGVGAALFVVAAASAPAQRSDNPSLLISTEELSKQLRDPSLVLLYVGPKEDYDAGHIPGARFVSLRDVVVDDTATHHVYDLPDEADLRGRLERLGIGDKSKVVVVPGQDWTSPPTRLVWTLQAAGLGARTRLLNGGTVSWRRAGLPLTKELPPAAVSGKLTLPPDRSIVVDYAWVRAHAHAPGIRLVDARDAVFYEGPGMPEHNAKAGHIAGAISLPFSTMSDDSARFYPLDDLRQKFAAVGIQPADTVVAYCHVGQQATAVLFSARLLGHPIKLYDGSMADWNQRSLPLENGKAPKSPEPTGYREPR